MRLHRIALTDYRGVRGTRTVNFREQGVTIVSGPNEIGKTSLVEALDLLLEEKASSTRREIMAVQPSGRDVGPIVEAELSFGRYRVVYRKQWIKGKTTELRVLSPSPEQAMGNAAHERFAELLHEAGIDLFLWRQLRISQDWQRGRVQGQRTDGQSAIAGLPAVSGALEQQTSQVARTGPEEALFERARRQYELYYTPKRGEPRGDYVAARAALDEANGKVAAAKQALADAEGAIAQQTRLRAESQEAKLELEEARSDLAQLEESSAELVRLRDRLGGIDAALALARQIEAATDDLNRYAARRARLDTELAAAAQDLAAAQEDHRAAQEQAGELRTAAEQVRAALRLAGDDVRWHQDRMAADRLAALLERAQDAARRVRAADQVLAANPVTEEVLERIESAHKLWDKAAALLHANAATVAVTPLGDAPVSVMNGDHAAGAAGAGPDPNPGARDHLHGDATSYPAVESITVEAPGVVRVVISPGAGEGQRREKERTAREKYRELCAAAGAADLAAAKDAHRRRRIAQEDRRAAVQDRDAAVANAQQDGAELPDLHDRLAALKDRIAAHEAGRPAGSPMPQTLEAALAAQERLGDEREQIEAHLRVADDAAGHEESRVVGLREQIASLGREAQNATADTALAEARLAELPAAQSAPELERLRAERQAAADRIEQLGPQQLELRLATARRLPTRLEEEQAERRERLAMLAERIAAFADSGPEESLDVALAHQARAQRTYERLHRDAAAAKLLYETLDRHRSRAWLRYAEPFRALVEKYAAGVFGPGVGIAVAEDLTITAKTSDGATVPFDQLSAGAREQLALLGRIACAELITPQGAQDAGGVPLILDDALGHTDRTRLNQLAAILDRAGDRVQIILLTHAPDRFRIGGAHSVIL